MTSILGAPGPGTVAAADSTCRTWVLRAIDVLEREHGRDAFSLHEIVAQVLSMGGPYTPATVRATVMSTMCIEARAHRTVYSDLERVRRGFYRRLPGVR